MVNKPEPVEMHLMTLGAFLVRTHPKAARIVSAAMQHIEDLTRERDELRKQLAGMNAPKARARKPRQQKGR